MNIFSFLLSIWITSDFFFTWSNHLKHILKIPSLRLEDMEALTGLFKISQKLSSLLCTFLRFFSLSWRSHQSKRCFRLIITNSSPYPIDKTNIPYWPPTTLALPTLLASLGWLGVSTESGVCPSRPSDSGPLRLHSPYTVYEVTDY